MKALGHVRIVELSEAVAGEYCGKLLADFGAEVVKVERPGGSPTRAIGPFAGDEPGPERSGLFAYLNTNKRSVTLDLGGDAGREALARLVAASDVVIDDHGAHWLAGVGLDLTRVEQDQPALILCGVTPFGWDAPRERAHATDMTVIQSSGWGFHTPSAADPARPPLNAAGRFLPSYEAGLEGALCVAASLVDLGRTGRGRTIDVSMQEVMASRVDYVLGQMVAGDMDVGPERDRFDLGGPASILPCRDGFIYVWMSAPSHWQGLRQLLGDPAWMAEFPADWLERGLTPERIARCREGLTGWLATRGKEEAAEAAQAVGITLVPVNDAGDLPGSAQLRHRGFFAELDHPVIGRAAYPTVPYRLSATPARIEAPAPPLAEASA
jgi:crotonobetainyl-CoA:carnitine CoA-transferase CaiB-like acyl-CoA transferase